MVVTLTAVKGIVLYLATTLLSQSVGCVFSKLGNTGLIYAVVDVTAAAFLLFVISFFYFSLNCRLMDTVKLLGVGKEYNGILIPVNSVLKVPGDTV